MKGKLLMTVTEMEADRKAWENLRRQGIGGSDIACIMGYNPWKSKYALWCEKVGIVEPEDLSDNEYIYWGRVNEAAIANRFCEDTSKKVKKYGTLADEAIPYLLANVDRLVVGENAGLECKTTSSFKIKEWDDDNLPDAYYCQCQWYCMVTGADKWYIAVLIGGSTYRMKPVPRNDEAIAEMRAAAIDFWENHVIPKVPPEVDGSGSTAEALSKQYNAPREDVIELGSDGGKLIERLDELTATKKIVEEQIRICQNSLQAILGNYEQGIFNDRKVTWKMIKGRSSLDTRKLKAEMPEIYSKYTVIGNPVRRFSVK